MSEWIEWNGGECPVDGDAYVEYETRNGRKSYSHGKNLSWVHIGSIADIIKYRVVSEAKPQAKPIQYQIGIDTFDRAKANMTPDEILAVCKFNIDRYTWRVKGQDKDDFKKIKDYADLALWAIEKKGKQ